MTVSTETTKSATVVGNGVTTAFPFAFKIFQTSDVSVVLAAVATGAETVLTEGVDYSVSMNADQETDPGGEVTYPLSGSPMASTHSLTLVRNVPYTQGLDLTLGGSFNPDNIEQALDRSTVQIQQVNEAVSRSLKTAVSTPPGVDPTLPAPVPYALVGWNAAGDGLQNTDPTYSTILATDLASTAAGEGDALIGYRASGTGATGRTVHARLADLSVSVKDFGAVGDGVTDNYAAFTAALSALSASGGGVLYVPGGASGDYLFKTQAGVSPSIGIPSNVTICSDPDVYFLVEGGASAAGVNTYTTALFKNSDMVNGNKNIGIIGGRFKSTTSTNCGGLLAFKNVIGLHVERVQLLDIVGACRFQASYCANVSLVNGLVDYETPHAAPWSYEDGLRIGSGCVNVRIAGWRINSGDDCIAINNELSETQMAITPQSGLPAYSANGALIKNVSVSDIDVECQAGNALRVYQGPGMTVGTITRVNVVGMHGKPRHPTTGWGTAVSLYDNSGSTTNAISDVVIDGFNLDCLHLGTSGVGSPSAISIETTGGGIRVANGVLGGVTTPYGIGTSNDTQIANVTISGCANDSIYVGGDYNIITGCSLTNAGVYGIHVSAVASQTVIVGNRVLNSASSAVREEVGAAYTTCVGNDFTFSPVPSIAGNASSFYDGNLGLLNPSCSVYRSGNQSIGSGVYTKVELNGEDFDTNSNFDSTTNYRFQPTVPGYYQIDGKVSSSGSTTASACAAAIYKNGSAYKYGPYIQATAAESGVSAVVYLNGSTDYVEMYAYIIAATAVIGGGSAVTYLSATMIRG